MIETKKSLELKKNVGAIHSTNKLSLLQRKIANALLFNAYDDLLEKEEHEINIGSLCRLIGYTSNDHKTIKKSLINLLSTVLEWNLVDREKLDSNGVWNASSIIADASIDGSICTYSYSNKMKKLLFRPDMYGRINMAVQSKFQSSYGLALYENCIRYQDIGQTPWFDLNTFRKLMGVEENKYKVFRDFKSRVLDKAIEEVNKYSPIFVDVQFRKQLRQVVAIQFFIKQKQTLMLSIDSDQLKISEILKSKFGFSKRQIEDTLTGFKEEYIREKISLIEVSANYKKGKIGNLAKYLLSALKEDYQPTKSSKPEKPNRIDEKPKREKEERDQQKRILELFNQLPKAKKSAALIKFKNYLKGIYVDIYTRDGLSNFQVELQLCSFIKEKMPELLAASLEPGIVYG